MVYNSALKKVQLSVSNRKELEHMTKDQYHIEMEDISTYPLERSTDYSFWEEITFTQLDEHTLNKLSEEKLKTFFGNLKTNSFYFIMYINCVSISHTCYKISYYSFLFIIFK